MGHQLSRAEADRMFSEWVKQYEVVAPKLMEGRDVFPILISFDMEKLLHWMRLCGIRNPIILSKKHCFQLMKHCFILRKIKQPFQREWEKDILIFLRSCDLHAVKRLDEIYLRNGFEDFYYARTREKAKFILMGCETTCDSGFCVSMGTNQTNQYDAYLKLSGDTVYVDIKCKELEMFVNEKEVTEVIPDFVTENKEKVVLPRKLSNQSFTKEIWQEYGERCIGCGRCNFVCPTCTCFTMQDIFYKDNPKVGERRRVWASCQVDGYTEMAGGHGFRQKQSDRMRFKVMHKIYDFEKRFGYPMCVGCGRCDDVCPEYISYSNCVNRLAKEENEE